MSLANIYEQIITSNAVEEAVKATLELWISEYLGELERIEGYPPDRVARPKAIITASEFAKWAEDQVPALVIVSPGLNGTPIRRKGGGAYEAVWSVTVAAIVGDVDALQSRRLAGTYAGAIRAAIMQHKMLRSGLHPDGFAQYLSWEGETYSDIPFDDTRGLDSCRVVFGVGVEDVVTEQAGPREPTGTPAVDPGDWPPVVSVQTTTNPVKTLP